VRADGEGVRADGEGVRADIVLCSDGNSENSRSVIAFL